MNPQLSNQMKKRMFEKRKGGKRWKFSFEGAKKFWSKCHSSIKSIWTQWFESITVVDNVFHFQSLLILTLRNHPSSSFPPFFPITFNTNNSRDDEIFMMSSAFLRKRRRKKWNERVLEFFHYCCCVFDSDKCFTTSSVSFGITNDTRLFQQSRTTLEWWSLW